MKFRVDIYIGRGYMLEGLEWDVPDDTEDIERYFNKVIKQYIEDLHSDYLDDYGLTFEDNVDYYYKLTDEIINTNTPYDSTNEDNLLKKRLLVASKVQAKRYEKLLKKYVTVEFSSIQKRYLLWLCSFDHETIETFDSILTKLRNESEEK